MENNFYKFKKENLNYFNLITLVFKKDTASKSEWDELFVEIDNMFNTLNSKYLLIINISELYFPGIHIIKKCAEILKKYPDNIDKYCIETSIIIPSSVLAKTIINTLFTFYTSRRPVHIKYSFEETYKNVLNTVNEYSKN
tara:strand:+ start:548 stop:967 length:420 start_codon:yes stop_codon:yes gene_type:complete